MKFIKYFFFLFLFSATVFAQNSNVTLLSHLDIYPSERSSNIWGYVDPSGTEYALLGMEIGTSIISLADPENPVECAFIPAPESSWRELKVHDHYAYVSTDQSGDGLQIIDLSQLPDTAILVNTLSTYFDNSHDLLIDNGYCYVVGGDFGGGMSILDLADPVNPVRTAYYTASGYIHDIYIWNDTIVASCGNSQNYHLVDVTNKSNPFKISESAVLPGIYAHSGWMTEDKRYFIATEEFNVRDMTVWDLQDRTAWQLIIPSWGLNNNSIIHNLYIIGNYAHVSYYTSGYLVLDISDPTVPKIAGQYDTYPQSNSGNYSGAWGVYPFLPSGITIISDINTGLYVLQFEGSVPVELTSFSAQVTQNGVTLNWETATELNNYGFNIERRLENRSDWKTVGLVSGSGTTTESKKYSYADNSLTQAGSYYYRLKQIDNDGSFEYSSEILVDFIQPGDFALKQNYPNPFNPSTSIEFVLGEASFVKLEVYNSLGEKVADLLNENKEQGSYKINFESTNLPSGIYVAKLETGSKVQTIKMSLLK